MRETGNKDHKRDGKGRRYTMTKRKRLGVALLLSLCLLTASCARPGGASSDAGERTFTDSLGNQVRVASLDRVVSLYGSFSEAWLLAGGTLAGTTSDAIEEGRLPQDGSVAVVGTVKQPNVEAILALSPTLVILSDDIGGEKAAANALEQAGVPVARFKVEVLEDYLAMMKTFTGLTGRADLYEQNARKVKTAADEVIRRVQGQPRPKVLFLRAFSTGAKAKGADHQTGAMLRDLGCENIADKHPSLLEELSLEEILTEDPDFIFVVTMGSDGQKALDALKTGIQANPAWATLSAVKNGRYVVLPKDLFHYKPNARWGESYAYLANILYPAA